MTRRRRKRLGDAASCPTYDVQCVEEEIGYIRCSAVTRGNRNRKVLGEIDLNKHDDVLVVGMIETAMKRCGVGTKLYEAALDQACRRGLRLSSDATRTAASEGFWQKQVRKGRARCAPHAGGAEKLNERFLVVKDERWPCKTFQMNEVCPSSIDLSGLRGAKKTPAELESFLRKAVPNILERHMFSCYRLKQCSGVAPAFSHLARKHGFEARTVHGSKSGYGHYYNLVDTTDGVYEVDLSEMQFRAPADEGEDAYYDFVDEMIAQTKKNPLSEITFRKSAEVLPREDEYRFSDEGFEAEERAFESFEKRKTTRVGKIRGRRVA